MNREQLISIVDSKGVCGFGGRIDEECYKRFSSDYSSINRDMPLTVRIHSRGGSVLSALMIANILASHKGKLIIEVPNCALSSAAFLSLLGDEIVVNEFTTFGPFDPSWFGIPLRPISENLSEKQNSWIDAFYKIVSSKFSSIVSSYHKILSKKFTPDEVDEILKAFVYTSDHDTPIFVSDLPPCVASRLKILPIPSVEVEFSKPNALLSMFGLN